MTKYVYIYVYRPCDIAYPILENNNDAQERQPWKKQSSQVQASRLKVVVLFGC